MLKILGARWKTTFSNNSKISFKVCKINSNATSALGRKDSAFLLAQSHAYAEKEILDIVCRLGTWLNMSPRTI